MFNPTSYSISKSVSWTPPKDCPTEKLFNAPRLEFAGGGSRVLTLELFFDATAPINGRRIDDVRQETDKIVNLTRIERESQQPPVCMISWGSQSSIGLVGALIEETVGEVVGIPGLSLFNKSPSAGLDFPFKGVVTNLEQNFTLFKRNGKPVRATLNVRFTEFFDPEEDKRYTDPELTTRQIKRGDTLSSIASEAYNDPKRWRVIAEANGIDDPRRLEIGETLTIPKQ
ncbi:MAG: LysM peptidoglycan-binding domain-containing protein [Cyanobacteria bacterium CRU_2_1]|nr:LysM peptidoglycan-binding domain-containing protein [Cyanobacteria bacterium RU_5_0]NJR57843.1 LysM peptidoglycan-binding domain-containing protein [Cyanobacteria bacterium CRU_2_1]